MGLSLIVFHVHDMYVWYYDYYCLYDYSIVLSIINSTRKTALTHISGVYSIYHTSIHSHCQYRRVFVRANKKVQLVLAGFQSPRVVDVASGMGEVHP